jgi:hypothetical protein
MPAWLELASFHLAVFVCAAVVVFFGCATNLPAINTTFFVVWLCVSVLVVVAISAWTGAHSRQLWESAEPHGSVAVLFIGHLGLFAAGAIYLAMAQAGTGSGLVLLLPMSWAGLFYLIGIFRTVDALAESKIEKK